MYCDFSRIMHESQVEFVRSHHFLALQAKALQKFLLMLYRLAIKINFSLKAKGSKL